MGFGGWVRVQGFRVFVLRLGSPSKSQRIQGFGFRGFGVEFRVSSFGGQGFGFQGQGFGVMVSGLGLPPKSRQERGLRSVRPPRMRPTGSRGALAPAQCTIEGFRQLRVLVGVGA